MGMCLSQSESPQNQTIKPLKDDSLKEELKVESAQQIELNEEDRVELSSFEFLRILGRGGYGKVVLVSHKLTNKLYAMKIQRKDLIAQLKSKTYSQNERNILATMNCPFIVSLHYAFQTQFKLYLVVDFLQGGELFFHLKRMCTFPEEWVVFYSAEIIIALEFLHSKGIVYRDLKPENVLLAKDGHIKLTDFGLCKTNILEEGLATTLCGTYDYMAPEIYLQRGHNYCSDWYSLGILLYVMLSGLPPYYSQNKRQMLRNRLEQQLQFPEKYFSSQAQDLIAKLLVINPKQRLGNNGVEDIKQHRFFSRINWRELELKNIQPPFKPKLFGEKDLRNFDKVKLKKRQNFSNSPKKDSMILQLMKIQRIIMTNSPFEDHHLLSTKVTCLQLQMGDSPLKRLDLIFYYELKIKNSALLGMDHQKLNINFQDFQEVEPEQEYIVLGLGKWNKKYKSYDKVYEKFKNRLSEGLIYVNNNLIKIENNDSSENPQTGNSYIIDCANNHVEIVKEAIIGTQILIDKKQRKNLAFADKFQHFINLNPQKYQIEELENHNNLKQESQYDEIYNLLDQEKQKLKILKKKKKVKINPTMDIKIDPEENNICRTEN